jgi:hypothetical protein
MTVAEIIDIAIGSQPLAANDIARKGNAGGTVDLRLPRKIYMIRKNVERRYGQDPTDTTLTATANYLLALCQPYGLAAQNKSGIAGTIAGVSTTGGTPDRIDFKVDSSTSYMITGQSSVTITAFIGFNLEVDRNGIPQSTLSSQASYFTWIKATGLLTISPALSDEELIALIPS